jgi:hypothetical protein
MNCEQTRKLLGLFTSGDLNRDEASAVSVHLRECTECSRFSENLEASQSLLRSLRRESVTPAALSQMRGSLFTRLENPAAVLGWRIRLERFLLRGSRTPRYAFAGLAIAGIISVTLFAQMHRVAAGPADPMMVTLDRPDFGNWKVIDPTAHEDYHAFEKAYINPNAYRVFTESGKFPEGTVLILDQGKTSSSVLASVKDSRFEGGWGYFEFKNGGTPESAKASPLPKNAGCFACHRDRAATDHVFTQFYPVLRTAAGVL